MAANLIQATYADLDQVAKRFETASNGVEKLTGQITRSVQALEAGSWKGLGAESFFKEMDQLVMPALARLSAALVSGADTINKINEIMRLAEMDAAQPFQMQNSDMNAMGVPNNLSGSYGFSGGDTVRAPGFDQVNGGKGAKYGKLNGTPFVKGTGDSTDIHPSDVKQGQIGDCFLMTALATLAQQNPGAIRKMINDNGDGTYTVTLFKKMQDGTFQQVPVLVNSDFPMKNGAPVFARPGDGSGANSEMWPMLIEKAYAQIHGGYNQLDNGGNIASAMEGLTGRPSNIFTPNLMTIEQLERIPN